MASKIFWNWYQYLWVNPANSWSFFIENKISHRGLMESKRSCNSKLFFYKLLQLFCDLILCGVLIQTLMLFHLTQKQLLLIAVNFDVFLEKFRLITNYHLIIERQCNIHPRFFHIYVRIVFLRSLNR